MRKKIAQNAKNCVIGGGDFFRKKIQEKIKRKGSNTFDLSGMQ